MTHPSEDGFIYETYGESQVYLEGGWYSMSELKELIANLELTEKRQKKAIKQMMGVKK